MVLIFGTFFASQAFSFEEGKRYLGRGVYCDTADQIEQVMNLAQQKPLQVAMDAVNATTDTNSCALIVVIYEYQREVKKVSIGTEFFVIHEVLVVGIPKPTPYGLTVTLVPPRLQYNYTAAEGTSA